MGTVTKTIGIGGTHDYSSLAAWAAALPANLVTDGNAQVGQCYFNGAGDGEFVSATALLNITGHTTSATDNITLTTGPGQSFRDNAGVQTNALRYNAANGVAIRNSSYPNTVTINNAYVIVSNIQIKGTLPNYGNGQALSSTGATAGNQYNNLLLESGGSVVAYSYNGDIFRNCLFRLIGSARTAIVSIAQRSSFYFCDLVAASDLATAPSYAIKVQYNTSPKVTMENCAVFGASVIADNPTYCTFTTCMTDVALPPTGFTGSETYANQFVNTTIASGDYRQKTGANLRGAGTADSTNGAFDIAGTARPQGSNWDIGCWELVAAGGGPSKYLTKLLFSLPGI